MMWQQRIDQEPETEECSKGLKMGQVFLFRGVGEKTGKLPTSSREMQIFFSVLILILIPLVVNLPGFNQFSPPLDVGKSCMPVLHQPVTSSLNSNLTHFHQHALRYSAMVGAGKYKINNMQNISLHPVLPALQKVV